jgi:hypothetical protein
MLRPDLLAVLHPLLESPEESLSLDRIAEAIGALPVSSDDIDEIFTWLEERGHSVGEAPVGLASTALRDVLASARSLKLTLGRTPNAAEIGEHSGLGVEAVQRALFFSKILQR